MAGGIHGNGGMRGRRDGHCSGWYASYWNAFLFSIVIFNRFLHRTKCAIVKVVLRSVTSLDPSCFIGAYAKTLQTHFIIFIRSEKLTMHARNHTQTTHSVISYSTLNFQSAIKSMSIALRNGFYVCNVDKRVNLLVNVAEWIFWFVFMQ